MAAIGPQQPLSIEQPESDTQRKIHEQQEEIKRLRAVIEGEDAQLGHADGRSSEGPIRRVQYKVLADATKNFSASLIIGRGSFGAVYKGTWGGQAVAVKRCDVSSSSGVSSRSISSLQTLSLCQHQHILPLLGYANGPLCLVYPFMSGGSLADRLKHKEVVLRMDSRLRIAWEVASGLAYLHAPIDDAKPCIVHGDVKSADVFLDDRGDARLGDAGLAQQVAEGSQMQTQVVGTPGYLDPECAETLHLTTASDVFALGVILLELLTGTPPVDTSLSSPMLHARLRPRLPGDALALAEEGCGFTAAGARVFGEVAERCTVRSADDRPSAFVVVVDFGPFVAAAAAPASGASARECVVCMDRPRGTRLLPCLCAALCVECASDGLYRGQPCPMCCEPVRSFQRGTFD